jgi:hypothetical protein
MSEADQEFIRLLARLQELYLSALDLNKLPTSVDGTWRLGLAQQENYLLAVASGRLSFHQALAQFFSMQFIANSKGLERILVDATASEGDMTDAEREELGMKVAQYSATLSGTTRIAIVGQPPVITGIGAAVARAYGLPCETFSDRREALKWLSDSSRNTPETPVFP